MLGSYAYRSTQPEHVVHTVMLEGAGTDDPEILDGTGAGLSVSRDAAGVYTISWNENPGRFRGWHVGLGADDPSDLEGYTVVRDGYDDLELEFRVYNAEGTLADLAADQYLDIEVKFATSAVSGA